MIKYDKRIDALIEECCGEVLADIGCDHGYVAVGAVLSGKVKRAVAIDISEKSLEKTRLLSEQTGVADKVRCLCGNGFAPLDEDVDVAVIAGMGGVEIISVLEAAGDKLPARLVLCPHQNAYELRRWLNGRFRIVKDSDNSSRRGRKLLRRGRILLREEFACGRRLRRNAQSAQESAGGAFFDTRNA